MFDHFWGCIYLFNFVSILGRDVGPSIFIVPSLNTWWFMENLFFGPEVAEMTDQLAQKFDGLIIWSTSTIYY